MLRFTRAYWQIFCRVSWHVKQMAEALLPSRILIARIVHCYAIA